MAPTENCTGDKDSDVDWGGKDDDPPCGSRSHDEPRGSGSNDAGQEQQRKAVWDDSTGSDAEDDLKRPYSANKNNMLVGFVSMGKDMKESRMDDYSDNVYLANWHVTGVGEFSTNLADRLSNTGKYMCKRESTGNLGVVVPVVYADRCDCVAEGSEGSGKKWSRWALFKISWKGVVGGSKETVVAVFHIHHDHATSGENVAWDRVGGNDPVFNRVMLKMSLDVNKHSARLLMGDANMSMFAGKVF